MTPESERILPKEEREFPNGLVNGDIVIKFKKALESAEEENRKLREENEEFKERIKTLDRVMRLNAGEAQELWKKQQEEIQRLKGLVEKALMYFPKRLYPQSMIKYIWEKFKEENNI